MASSNATARPPSQNDISCASKAVPNSRRSVTPTTSRRSHSSSHDSAGRVRVTVRLRPRIGKELVTDADFADCVELQPELKRLKLRKNNWSSESYRFDEVFTDTASQKRVYDVVAKPVVECVLEGYNGTVMAYGQTGTGKTYTVGRLGKDDISERGIMVRAVDDIIASTEPTSDSLEISYVQLYMESIQDLLAPERVNISISEDPRTGEVSLPGATICRVRNLDHFFELMQVGEANRYAANTKQNTESSRSHAVLTVYLRRPVHQKLDDETDLTPKIRKSKLLIVDLAGSERLDKSGSESHLLDEAKFINLSLTSLGKCINALAENSPHIPTRESKLTRLLRDSFGGSARTSMIVTIGPSARHRAETISTITFGQRAMKIVNMIKLKEEFDYESLCRKLEAQMDRLTAELEREQKFREMEKFNLEQQLSRCQDSFAEKERNLVVRSELLENENADLLSQMKDMREELKHHKAHNELMLDKVAQFEMSVQYSQQQQLESSNYQKVLADTTHMYEKRIAELTKHLDDECASRKSAEQQLDSVKKLLSDSQKFIQQQKLENSTYQKVAVDSAQRYERKIAELNMQLEDEYAHSKSVVEQSSLSRKLSSDHQNVIEQYEAQTSTYQKALADITQRYEQKIAELLKQLKDEEQRYKEAEEQLVLEGQQVNMEPGEMQRLIECTRTKHESLKSDYRALLQHKEAQDEELFSVRQRLLAEENQRKAIEHQLGKLQKRVSENGSDFEENIANGSSSFGTFRGLLKSNPLKETLASQTATIAKICEEVGLQKILQWLSSEDSDVQTHAVKVIANLAAKDPNQEKIVEEGGLDALLTLLSSSQNTIILRVASGAIANLAMNEMIQGLIISKGGAQLLAKTASKTTDPQTHRMIAGALANLCGNERLHAMIQEGGGIQALLEMGNSRNADTIAQVARAMANFAKCESRAIIQGRRRGQSLLLEGGVLKWLISNSNTTSTSTRRHVELALCHLAQNKDNIKDFTSCGGIQELVRISVKSSREDICNLAKKTLRMYPEVEVGLH